MLVLLFHCHTILCQSASIGPSWYPTTDHTLSVLSGIATSMSYTKFLDAFAFAFLFAATSTVASPIIKSGVGGSTTGLSFTVTQVTNPYHNPRSAWPLSSSSTRKNQFTMSDHNSSASVGAVPWKSELAWLVPFQIGTPPRTFYLDVDTGSSDTWLYAAQPDFSTSEHTVYGRCFLQHVSFASLTRGRPVKKYERTSSNR